MIGLSVAEAKRLSWWEFMAVAEYYSEAQKAAHGEMTSAEKDEIWEWMQAQPRVPLTHRKPNGH